MLTQVMTTTSMLVMVSLLSKLMATSQAASAEQAKSYELLRNCIHWRDLAQQDTDLVLRLQHATTAAALLQSSRMLARDIDLERASGMDISNLVKSLDQTVSESRDLLKTRKQQPSQYPSKESSV